MVSDNSNFFVSVSGEKLSFNIAALAEGLNNLLINGASCKIVDKTALSSFQMLGHI